jgi:hypothetical protein
MLRSERHAQLSEEISRCERELGMMVALQDGRQVVRNGDGNAFAIRDAESYGKTSARMAPERQAAMAGFAEDYFDWILETLRKLCASVSGVACRFESRLGDRDAYELQIVGIKSDDTEKMVAKMYVALKDLYWPIWAIDMYYIDIDSLFRWFAGQSEFDSEIYGQIVISGFGSSTTMGSAGKGGFGWTGEIRISNKQGDFTLFDEVKFSTYERLFVPAVIMFLREGVNWYFQTQKGYAQNEYRDARNARMVTTSNHTFHAHDWYKLVRPPPADWEKQRTRRESGGAPLQVRLC